MGTPRDVIAFGAVGTLGLLARPTVPVSFSQGVTIMEGWLLILAILGAVWLMFRD